MLIINSIVALLNLTDIVLLHPLPGIEPYQLLIMICSSYPFSTQFWQHAVFQSAFTTLGECPPDLILSYYRPTPWQVFVAFLPEITLAFMIIYMLTIMTVELSRGRAPKVLSIECWRAACVGLAFVSMLYVIQLCGTIYNGPALYGYLYISRGLSASKLFVALASLFVLHLSGNYIREHTRHVLEYSVVVLLAVLLLLILVSANNLMLTFFALAAFSLNLYTLVLYDGLDYSSREAALKYFYLSAFSAGLILFGTALIYVTYGDATYGLIRFLSEHTLHPRDRLVTGVGVLFILLGFFFKLSAFPGHLWAPEVYEGAPLPVTTFFMIPVKVAVFITLLRLLNTCFVEFSHVWLPTLSAAGIVSVAWGAFAAAQARKTVRFLAYASINQIGLLLLGIVLDTDDGLRSAYLYLILYAITSGGFLLAFTHLRTHVGATFVAISDFRGLARVEPLICWHLAVFLFSMAGVPPLAGFFAKFYLLSALVERGLFIPAIVILSTGFISAYYYLRIIKTFWFEEDNISPRKIKVLLSEGQRMQLSILEVILWMTVLLVTSILPSLDAVVFTLTICGDASCVASSCRYFSELPQSCYPPSIIALFCFMPSTVSDCLFANFLLIRFLPSPIPVVRKMLSLSVNVALAALSTTPYGWLSTHEAFWKRFQGVFTIFVLVLCCHIILGILK